MERWFIVLAIVWVGFCPATAGTRVVVDASCGYVVGEQAAISGRMFGVTAFEGFPNVVWDADYRGKLAALRPGALRFPV